MYEIKCIIVEDEPLAAKVLIDYIAQIPFLKLEGNFKDAILATDWLRTNHTHLIFLDIHLPKLKGLAFLKTLLKPPSIIITTAYNQYAVEGFELNVTDYLLKPFGFERFLEAVNKLKFSNDYAYEINKEIEKISINEVKDHVFVNVQKKKVKVLFSDIIYIESQREYIKIITTKKEYVCKMSTHEIEALLPTTLFKRVHRSFIISIKKIDAFTAEIIEVNGIEIPIGRGYRNILEGL